LLKMQGMGRADEYQAELIKVVAGIKISEEYRVVEEGRAVWRRSLEAIMCVRRWRITGWRAKRKEGQKEEKKEEKRGCGSV